MGPISESGWQPGWFQNGPSRAKGQLRDPDVDRLPYRAKSLVAMLRRRLKQQQAKREYYVRVGKIIERPAATASGV